MQVKDFQLMVQGYFRFNEMKNGIPVLLKTVHCCQSTGEVEMFISHNNKKKQSI